MDGEADFTLVAGGICRAQSAIERLGEEPRHGGLADAPGPAEEVRMADALIGDGVPEGTRHVLLADDFVEAQGPVAPGEDGIRGLWWHQVSIIIAGGVGSKRFPGNQGPGYFFPSAAAIAASSSALRSTAPASAFSTACCG